MSRELRITALRHSAFYSPLLVTIASGLLEEQGFKPVYKPAGPGQSVSKMLESGEYHVSQSAVAASFAALNSGRQTELRHFAQINERDGFFIAARAAQTGFQWSDLVGKQVLVDHFFQPLAMLRYGLHRQGIDLADLRVIDAGDVTAIDQAFRNGQGDFVHQQGPAPQQLEADGVGRVVAAVGDIVGPVAFSSLCAHRRWLDTDDARRFMVAYRRGQQLVIEESAAVLAGMVSPFLPEIELQVLTNTIGMYQQLGCWTGQAEISIQSYEQLLDVFEFAGLINERFDYRRCVVHPPA